MEVVALSVPSGLFELFRPGISVRFSSLRSVLYAPPIMLIDSALSPR
jgi:hypothetical protein